jgi:hypothetical protein
MRFRPITQVGSTWPSSHSIVAWQFTEWCSYVVQFRSTLEEPPYHQTLITVAPGVTTTVHIEDVEPEFL